MAIVTLNKKIFENEIGKFDGKMQDRISMFGTPVESFNDKEIQIEVFPNRPDLLSYHGFKRAFLAFLGKKTGPKKYVINKPKKDYRVIIDSSVTDIRPYTACAIVEEIKLDDEKIKEIIEVQEKLHATFCRKRKKAAIGIYPLEKIKLPITFKALEPDKIKFIPLEAEREMSGLEILQRHPAGRDYAPLLSGKEKFPIFIDADNNIMSMPPIINSQLTGKVTEETKKIFIECSGFDFNILKKCLNILVTTFSDMGGKIFQIEITGSGKSLLKKKETTPSLEPEKFKISLENTNKILGLNINEKKLKELLERMGHSYGKSSVLVPAWRTDIMHEVDIIEDVAIAFGYENFAPEIPEISTIGGEDSKESFKKKIAEILAGVGIMEISNYHLTNKNDQFRKMGVQENHAGGFIEVKDSKTDYTILRKDLTHFLLKVFSENVDAEYPQKIFETGRVFNLEKSKISEGEKLSVAISPGNFTEIKQVFDYLFRMINLEAKFIEPNSDEVPPYFIDGRTAKIFLNSKEIGFIGEIHPRILKNWRIKMPVALFEINLEEILI